MKPNLPRIRSCVRAWPSINPVLLRVIDPASFEQFKKNLPDRRRPPVLEDVTEFTRKFSDLQTDYIDRHRAEAPFANIFNILRLGPDEVRHSRFLAWLMDGEETHLQGSIFLQSFLQAIDMPQQFTEEPYEVWRERPDRIDISIHSQNRFAIYIENKIDAGEGHQQLSREYASLSHWSRPGRWNVPPEGRVLVFLTPDGRLPETLPDSDTLTEARFVALSYPNLVAHLWATAMSDRCSSKFIRRLVRDYIGTIQNIIARQ